MFLSQLKGIHWAAIGQAVGAAFLVALAQQPQLAPVSNILNTFAAMLGAGSLGTMGAAHKIGYSGSDK